MQPSLLTFDGSNSGPTFSPPSLPPFLPSTLPPSLPPSISPGVGGHGPFHGSGGGDQHPRTAPRGARDRPGRAGGGQGPTADQEHAGRR